MANRHRIYDRCQYVNCKNGRHNDHHLFRFPSKLDRQKIWVENSGNEAIKHWTPASLMCAGICRDHFREHIDYFQAKKLRLRVNRNPIHWKDAELMKQKNAELEAQIKAEEPEIKIEHIKLEPVFVDTDNNEMEEEEIIIYTTKEATPNLDCLKILQLNSQQEMKLKLLEEQREKDKKEIEQVQQYIAQKRDSMKICVPTNDYKNSHTIPEDKIPIIPQLNYDLSKKTKVKQYVNINKVNNDKEKINNTEEKTTNLLNPPNVVVNSENKATLNKVFIPKSRRSKSAPITSVSKEKQNKCTLHCKMLFSSLKHSTTLLKRKVQQLKTDLRTQKKKNYHLFKLLEKESAKTEFRINDYLNSKEITSVAKTMIKLQLHNGKVHYSNDEKNLTKEMYYYSPSYYNKLRLMGLNLPCESTTRAWLIKNNKVALLN